MSLGLPSIDIILSLKQLRLLEVYEASRTKGGQPGVSLDDPKNPYTIHREYFGEFCNKYGKSLGTTQMIILQFIVYKISI